MSRRPGGRHGEAPRSADIAGHCRYVLDRLRAGVLLVRADRTVSYANDEGRRLARCGAGVAISLGGRLLVREADGAGAVHDALALAASPSPGGGQGPILRTRIGRGRLTVPLVLEVHALVRDDDDGEEASRPALVLLIDVGSVGTDAVVDRLAVACGFTPAEREVCRALVTGRSMIEVARSRRVGLETVRTQVRALGRKTGTRSRTALVRLAMLMASPIDGGRVGTETIPRPGDSERTRMR